MRLVHSMQTVLRHLVSTLAHYGYGSRYTCGECNTTLPLRGLATSDWIRRVFVPRFGHVVKVHVHIGRTSTFLRGRPNTPASAFVHQQKSRGWCMHAFYTRHAATHTQLHHSRRLLRPVLSLYLYWTVQAGATKPAV